MKSTSKDTERDPAEKSAEFDRQPEKKKDLMKLKEQLEESSGPEEAAITRKIDHQARKPGR